MTALLRKLIARARRALNPEPARPVSAAGAASVLPVNVLADDLIVCNFCGTVFKHSGPNHSEFLACPCCDAVARERVMYHCILSEQHQRAGTRRPFIAGNTGLRDSTLLECSPRLNPNRSAIYHQVLGGYLAADFDRSAHQGHVKIDLTLEEDVGAHLDAFDIILCAHVLEHIPDYLTALKNLWRMLRAGGYAVLQVPLLEQGYTRVTWDEFHGDNTRVFHRFGFDLLQTLDQIFTGVTPVVGMLDFDITSPEISREKYTLLKAMPERCHILGAETVKTSGLGIPDLCDAFILRK